MAAAGRTSGVEELEFSKTWRALGCRRPRLPPSRVSEHIEDIVQFVPKRS